jgi:hypothetical protein
MDLIRRLIRTDGTMEDLAAGLSIEAVRELIGADTLDVVNLRHMGTPLHVMIVDDHGYEVEHVQVSPQRLELRPVRALKPVNEFATVLYRANRPATCTHQIVGDVVVLPDEDYACDISLEASDEAL